MIYKTLVYSNKRISRKSNIRYVNNMSPPHYKYMFEHSQFEILRRQADLYHIIRNDQEYIQYLSLLLLLRYPFGLIKEPEYK